METITDFKEKSLLEKIAPVILIIGVIIFGYFLFSKFKPAARITDNTPKNTVQTTQIEVDTEFLMSPAFTKLNFIPDSSIFDEVTGDVPKGKPDPFAPIQ